eukprot:jgi/Botrbrau1/945/Bobra.0167s0054.1
MERLQRKGCAKLKTRRATMEDLNLELLGHILSLLEQPCGLWPLRMVSRAFRAAANRNMSRIKVKGCILLQDVQIGSIICRVSPELLCALHKQPPDLEGIVAIQAPPNRWRHGMNIGDAFYACDLLPHIIEAAVILPPSGGITARPVRAEECTDAVSLAPRAVPLEVALAHMPLLRRVRLPRKYRLPPNLIPHLTNVTSLELEETVSDDELAALAGVRSIQSLSLTLVTKEDVDLSASQVPLICSGAFSHLRNLGLDAIMEGAEDESDPETAVIAEGMLMAHVWRLSALTSLTGLSLSLSVSEDGARLDPLAALTGLRELHILLAKRFIDQSFECISASCSFLGSLTGLTSLELDVRVCLLGPASELVPRDALARLRKLSMWFGPCPPNLGDGFPLLAFLGSATALQELECTFLLEHIHELVHTPTYEALQHALAALGSLTHLRLTALDLDWDTGYTLAPLELCACASSLRSLVFEDFCRTGAHVAPRQGMFSSLHHLQCLKLRIDQPSLHMARLLEGINPPELTKLILNVDNLRPNLMEPIRRFKQLRELELWSDPNSLRSLLQHREAVVPQLCSLPRLTRLAVHVRDGYPEFFYCEEHAEDWRGVVGETLTAVQSVLRRMRHQSAWPLLELEMS